MLLLPDPSTPLSFFHTTLIRFFDLVIIIWHIYGFSPKQFFRSLSAKRARCSEFRGLKPLHLDGLMTVKCESPSQGFPPLTNKGEYSA
jgi:hypothetical protein